MENAPPSSQQASKASGPPLPCAPRCGTALKPKFGASAEIAALAKSFVMVNVEDDEEPTDSQFSPDGGYIPRILYMSASRPAVPPSCVPPCCCVAPRACRASRACASLVALTLARHVFRHP